jgi:uncharacterized DUF497 family protein
MKVNSRVYEFEWDTGNSNKNKLKHGVEDWECEEAFYDPRKVMLKDALHSDGEKRYVLLGKTSQLRLLFLAFTLRGRKVRIISACDVTKKKEVDLYEKAT